MNRAPLVKAPASTVVNAVGPPAVGAGIRAQGVPPDSDRLVPLGVRHFTFGLLFRAPGVAYDVTRVAPPSR